MITAILENIELQVYSTLEGGASGLAVNQCSDRTLRSIMEECDKLRREFRRQCLVETDDRILSRYFAIHQEALVALIDWCMAQVACTAGPERDFLHKLVGYLGSLVDLIQQRFTLYFDPDQKLPDNLKQEARDELQLVCDMVRGKFLDTAVDKNLIALVTEEFCEAREDLVYITFRTFYFIKRFKKELLSLDVSSDDLKSLQLNLCKALVRVNFNTDRFYSYCIDQIKGVVCRCETPDHRINVVSYFYKLCSQEYCDEQHAYVKEKLPLNVQLMEWLSHELDYLRMRQQLQLHASEDGRLPKHFKLNFDLSVSHIAYLLRVFVDSGVIQNKNVSELIRFLTMFASSKKAEVISYESLRLKFYNTEDSTREAVRRRLQAMIGKSVVGDR